MPWVLEPDALTAVESTAQITKSAVTLRLLTPPNIRIESTRATVEHYKVRTENGGPN